MDKLTPDSSGERVSPPVEAAESALVLEGHPPRIDQPNTAGEERERIGSARGSLADFYARQGAQDHQDVVLDSHSATEARVLPRRPGVDPGTLKGPDNIWGKRTIEALAENEPIMAGEYLKHARKQLQGMPYEVQHMVAGTMDLNSQDMPPELWAALSGGKRLAPVDAISQFGEVAANGQPKIDDATLYKIIEWHNQRHSAKQEQFEADQLPEQRKRFIDQLEAAVKKGVIPPIALTKIKRVEECKVYLDDGLNTIARNRSGAFNASSAQTGQHDRIVLIDPESRTCGHEFCHCLAGRDGNDSAKATMGLYRTFGGGEAGRQMDEAVADYMSYAIDRGKSHSVNPNRGRFKDPGYKIEAGLLHTLSAKGRKKVDIKLFMEAQMEEGADREAAGEDAAAVRLVNALHEAFPDDDVVAMLSNPALSSEDIHHFNQGISRKYALRRWGTRMLLRR